jgi:FHS family glucose/mannose:H+ symporter-like MFS transporter
VTRSPRSRPSAAAILGCLTLLTIGWTGLLVPSAIRSIEATFAQNDAGIGLIYLLYSGAYAVGSFGGGPLTERIGRRRVLVAAAILHGLGIASFGLAPTWGLFVASAALAGLGGGGLDGGSNGLYLDLFRTGRGRAMNLLHLFFSIGALSAPLVVGALIEGGVAWQSVFVGSALAPLVLAAWFAVATMPSGRATSSSKGATDGAARSRPLPSGLGLPIALLAVAMATYVASEVGVSSWLVRFLEPAPLSTATLGLSLFWGGLALGRLVSSAIADRFDHVHFTTACAVLLSVALIGAIIVPSLPASIALFALCGAASGPIFPMVQAIGGERYVDRSAAVSSLLTGFGVVGGTLYPALMGVLSVTVGLTVAMFGNVVLGFDCAGSLYAFGRVRGRD